MQETALGISFSRVLSLMLFARDVKGLALISLRASLIRSRLFLGIFHYHLSTFKRIATSSLTQVSVEATSLLRPFLIVRFIYFSRIVP